MARSKAETPDVWRMGNFVLRRREVPTFGGDEWKLTDGQVLDRVRKGQMGTVKVLEVSSLDGAWMTRLMPGSSLEALLLAYLDGDDGERPDPEWADMVLTNLMAASSIPNGYFHQGVALLLMAYCDPSLLRGGLRNGKARKFRRDAKRVRDGFLEWREEYDRYVLSQEEDGRYEENAAAAREVLGEE